MDMAAESVLQLAPDPGVCAVNPTFTAIVEGRPSAVVDNNFFLTVVPIEKHESKLLISTFPRANRDGVLRGQSDMKKQFAKYVAAAYASAFLFLKIIIFVLSSPFKIKSGWGKVAGGSLI